MTDPLACDLVPAAWPTSVPPVMMILAPEACFSVMIPSIVFESIPSRDVHRGFDLSEQFPLETTEMPASLMRASASACVSFRPKAATECKCNCKAYKVPLFSSRPFRLLPLKAYLHARKGGQVVVQGGIVLCVYIYSLVVTRSRLFAVGTGSCHREPEKKNVKKVCSSSFRLGNIGKTMGEVHSYGTEDRRRPSLPSGGF